MNSWWDTVHALFTKPTIDPTLEKINMNLEELANEINNNKVAIGSAIDLLNSLHSKLDAALAQSDPVAVQQLVDRVREGTNDLRNAVTANTDRPRFDEPPKVG